MAAPLSALSTGSYENRLAGAWRGRGRGGAVAAAVSSRGVRCLRARAAAAAGYTPRARACARTAGGGARAHLHQHHLPPLLARGREARAQHVRVLLRVGEAATGARRGRGGGRGLRQRGSCAPSSATAARPPPSNAPDRDARPRAVTRRQVARVARGDGGEHERGRRARGGRVAPQARERAGLRRAGARGGRELGCAGR